VSTAAQRTRVVAGVRVAPATSQPAKRADDRRAPLEVVAQRTRRVRRRLAPLVSAAVVSGSLLLVVIGHAELAQGQVRLANLQTEITSAQLLHQREVLALAQLENPSRILAVAEGTLHMASPSQVRQLAHVPLGVPLPAPHVAATTGRTPAFKTASGG
jgi:hypothetical protein